jgi:hypothetical protein
MKSTSDFATGERPKNWREGILLLEPRNKAPLAALTAAMASESVDDPEYSWFDEEVDVGTLTVNGAVLIGDTTIVVDQYGTRLKAGDMLYNSRTSEAVRVTSVTDDTTFVVTRGAGGSAAAAMNDNDTLVYVGSAYREGAGRPTGVSWNPTKRYNYTQIFRDAVEWTRTATKTRMRTGDKQKNDRRRALNKHMIGMERAFIFGNRLETTESGQPLRFTGGILSFLTSEAPNNVVTLSGGDLTMTEFEDYFAQIFAYGSREKLAFGSIGLMTKLSRLARINTSFQFNGNEKELNLSTARFTTAAGTLVLTEHPLFSQPGSPLANDLLVLDTANLKYRYITDTVLLKDRADKGVDGEAEEYLTEAGLEFHHPKTNFWLKGINSVSVG